MPAAADRKQSAPARKERASGSAAHEVAATNTLLALQRTAGNRGVSTLVQRYIEFSWNPDSSLQARENGQNPTGAFWNGQWMPFDWVRWQGDNSYYQWFVQALSGQQQPQPQQQQARTLAPLSDGFRATLYPTGLTPNAPLRSKYPRYFMDEKQAVCKAKTLGELAELISQGHGFEKHKGEFKVFFGQFYGKEKDYAANFDAHFDRARYKDIILKVMSESTSSGILDSGVGYAYWNDYYNTVVVHNMFAADGGTAFYSKNPKAYKELQARVVASFTEFL
jgi:hypothetical protein